MQEMPSWTAPPLTHHAHPRKRNLPIPSIFRKSRRRETWTLRPHRVVAADPKMPGQMHPGGWWWNQGEDLDWMAGVRLVAGRRVPI